MRFCYCWKYKLLFLLQISFAWFLTTDLNAQSLNDLLQKIEQSQNSREEVDLINQVTDIYLERSEWEQAIQFGERALATTDTASYPPGKAEAAFNLGQAFHQKQDYPSALNYYLQAERIYKQIADDKSLGALYTEIGALYQEQKLYNQALRYFTDARALRAKNNQSTSPSLLENVGFCYLQLGDLNEADNTYQELLQLYQSRGQSDGEASVLEKLSSIAQTAQDYPKATEYSQKLLEIYESANDPVGLSNLYNNLGFLAKRSGDERKALDYFLRALNISKNPGKLLTPAQQSILYLNTGVAYTNLNAYTKAKEYYEKALKIQERKQLPAQQARTYNYLAANHYVSGNNAQAFNTVNTAIELGEANDAKDVLVTSYEILSLVYTKERNPKKAQTYKQKVDELKGELAEDELKRSITLLQRQTQVEREEEEIRTLIAEREQAKELARKQAEEAEKRLKNLEIERKEKELLAERLKTQKLQRGQIEQQLIIMRQRDAVRRQEQQIERYETARKLQRILLEKRKIEEEQKQQELELLQKEKTVQQVQLDQAKARSRYFTWISALIGFMFIMMVIWLFNARRSNKKIRSQNQEITSRNQELQQQREEIMTQRDLIEEQNNSLNQKNEELNYTNEELNEKNRQINDSIRAAETIQQAILPQKQKFQELFSDYFVIFRPRDIVSGDFYWLSKIGDKTYISVVDCTGHGIPGAFMAMIGNTLLNEIVNESKITNPADILVVLHQRIVSELKQAESANQDGMDVGLCMLKNAENGMVEMTFSGAKRPVYYVTDGALQEIRGDKRAIGGIIRSKERHYTQKVVLLPRGSMLYLGSDGFEDTPNPERKKFGKQRLKKTLLKYAHLPLAEQKKCLLRELEDYQQNIQQRDDIAILGIRL